MSQNSDKRFDDDTASRLTASVELSCVDNNSEDSYLESTDADEESDDEATLLEEEALETAEEISSELENLQEESEIPISELLKKYGFHQPTMLAEDHNDISESKIDRDHAFDDTNNQLPSKRRKIDPKNINVIADNDDGESSDDSDYEPFIPSKPPKEPRVGEEYQIDFVPFIAESQKEPDSSKYREDMAECLWSPYVVGDAGKLEKQLRNLLSIPENELQFPDNADCLYSLYKTSGKVDEAVLTKASKTSETFNEFSDEEVRAFEKGLSECGKNFLQVQRAFLPTRNVSELVEFYYLWKKTENYDNFAAVTKLGRSKKLLDENVTDFMYRISQDIHQLPQAPLFSRECAVVCSNLPNLSNYSSTVSNPSTETEQENMNFNEFSSRVSERVKNFQNTESSQTLVSASISSEISH